MRIATALRAAVQRTGDAADPATRAIAARAFAEACLYTGRLNEARDAYEEATLHARATGHAGMLGQILVGRVGTLTLMGIVEGTDRLAAEARRLLTSAGDLSYLAKLHMNLGSAHYHAERYRAAYADYERAARYAQAAGDTGGSLAGLRLNQGIACTHLFRLEQARGLFLETEDRARRLGLDRLEAQAQFNRAALEALGGDYRLALAQLEKAEATFERQGVVDMQAASRLALAEVYIDLAMPAEALDLAQSAGRDFRAAGMELDARLADLAAAQSLLLAGRPQKALPILEQCLAFYTERRMLPRRTETQLALSRVQLALGRHGESAGIARRALQAARALGAAQIEARARCRLAEALLAQHALARAERTLEPAIAAAGALQVGVRFELWLLAGRIARLRGRRAESLRRLRRAVACIEDQRRLVPGLEMRARVFDRQVEAYHHLIALLVESGRPRVDAVFPLIEAARARGFRERRGRRIAPMPREVVEKRTLLGSLVRRLESLEFGDAAAQDPGERARLQQSILSLERTIARKVRRWEAGQASGADAAKAVGWRRLLARIRPDEAVVETFVAEDSIIAIVLRRERASMRVLPCRAAEVAATVEDLRFQIDLMAAMATSPVGSDEFHVRSATADLRALHDRILAPLRDILPERGRLTVIPHGILHHVPFECLHDGSAFVDERWVISRCPTADHLMGRRSSRGLGRAVIAGMIEGGPVSVRAEIEAIAACFPAGERRVLEDPTPAEFVEAIAGADVVHISTHGFFREDNPIFSRLSLKDGALFVADIANLRLRASVVVLSACNSGQVFPGKGDDLSGVAHGFLAAGARRLVAGRWRVHDEATAEWMAAFYGSLTGEARGDAHAALNAAGRAVRRVRPHPFYWGGFSLYGT